MNDKITDTHHGRRNGTRRPSHDFRVLFTRQGTPVGLWRAADGLYHLQGPVSRDQQLRRRALAQLTERGA